MTIFFSFIGSSSSDCEAQLDLLALRRLDDFPALVDVAFGFGDRHGLPFLVDLREPPQPRVVEADASVVFADDRLEDATVVARKADLIGCRIQLSPRNDDVCALSTLVAHIADKWPAFRTDFRFIAKLPQRFHEIPLVIQARAQFNVFAHCCLLEMKIVDWGFLFRVAKGSSADANGGLK